MRGWQRSINAADDEWKDLAMKHRQKGLWFIEEKEPKPEDKRNGSRATWTEGVWLGADKTTGRADPSSKKPPEPLSLMFIMITFVMWVLLLFFWGVIHSTGPRRNQLRVGLTLRLGKDWGM